MKVAVIIPTYNEKENIGPMLEEMVKISARPRNDKYITLVVDSNSPDGTGEIVKTFAQKHKNIILISDKRKGLGKSVVFAYRYALKKLSPDIVVTTEADFAYKPSYIPFAVGKVKEGYDVVGGWREDRHDPSYRRLASRGINWLTSATVGVHMHDYGCMLRAYRRSIVRQLVECDERAGFIPALANSLARRTAEIEVAHDSRAGGVSKYGLLKLVRLSFDLITGFSLLPIQLVSLMGILVALAGVGFGGFLFVRRLFVGPESEGVFTLFAILFVFIGILIFAVGLLGEYIGRIYLEVRRRPHYRVGTLRQPRV